MADRLAATTVGARDRRAVITAAVASLLLLLLMIGLLAYSLADVRGTTDSFSRRALVITDLANVQRELLALSRDVSRVDGSDEGYDAVELRLGLLQTHWTSTTRGLSGADELPSLTSLDLRLRSTMAAVEDALSAPDRAEALAELQPQLDRLDRQLKALYAEEEVRYHAILGRALESRGTTIALILSTLGLLTLTIAVLGVLARRSAKASMDEARAELASVERQYQVLVDQVREAIVTTDEHGLLTLVNPGWQRLTGHPGHQVIGTPLTDYIELPDFHADWPMDPDGETQTVRQAGLLTADGVTRWAEVSRRRRPEGWVITLIDVTGRVAATRELTRQARHDAMTGLANRAHLVARLQQALEIQADGGPRVGLVFLDLDRFKVVNDSMGHDFGDRLLREVSVRLRAAIRSNDLACRLGGDEFVVLCGQLDPDRERALRTVQAVADRVLAVLSAPMDIGGREIRVHASAGIALGEHGHRPDALLAEADAAMYHAKDRGRARSEIFDADLKARIDERLTVEQALRGVVERDELELWMQPVHRLADGALDGFEALLRWRHPQRGLVQPDRFLQIAEELGEIEPIGLWVLQEACRRAVEWRSYGPQGLRVSVNVSPVQFSSGELPLQVRDALRAAGLAPQRLELEITESVYLVADDHVLRQLEELEVMGVSIAMDDFGTGYSSLAALRELPVDVVKLDRSFVSGIGDHAMDEAIIRSTVAMAKATELQIVGEGIERVEQLQLLTALGCERGQGYLFSRPVPPGGERDVILKGVLGSLT